MKTERRFRKELTREQLLDTVMRHMRKIEDERDKSAIISLIETMVAEMVTAERCTLWTVDHEKQAFAALPSVVLPWGKGLLTKGLQEAKPFFVNTVEESPLYDPAIDNIADDAVKDILVYPVTGSEDEVLFLLEVAIFKHDLQQFTQNDLDILYTLHDHFVWLTPLIKQGRSAADNQSEQTINLLQEEKRQAERMVDSSTQFLAEVAHEIRTPMNAVMGFIDLLKVDEQDNERLIYLESAAKSGEMMIALINDLLDFAKIEKGMMALESINFDPIEEFSAMAPLFCARMKKKGIFFQLYLDPRLPGEIVSDPHRIKQILSNLIGNAIKFTPEGGEITLEVLYDKERSCIDFNVIDTGIGIAKENQAKIFDAYTQETSATSRKFGGTGLGLSISAKLAGQFGSGLQLESKEGQGSRFYFSLALEEKVIEERPILDLKKLDGLKPALIFSETFAPTQEIVKRYLHAFGIKEISDHDSCTQIDHTDFTHLFVSQDLIDYKKAQHILDNGISIIIFKATAFDFYTEDLNGPVKEIECTFGPDRLYDALLNKTKEKKSEQKKQEVPGPVGKYKKVIIVDDNNLNIHFMREVVKKLGAIVESASDGLEAIEIYKRMQAWNEPFDLILMDENMPNMNGTDAAKVITQIEKEKGYPHIPIIGISGDATEQQREKSLAAGMDECIFKPVNLKQITAVFEHFIKKS